MENPIYTFLTNFYIFYTPEINIFSREDVLLANTVKRVISVDQFQRADSERPADVISNVTLKPRVGRGC